MKSAKHQGMTAAPPVTSDDHPATPTTTGVNPNDYGAAILFLEMKGRMQETRIAELEEMVQTLATEFQKFTGNTSTGNTTNNTTNVNLIVQMAVDNDNKVGVISGMGCQLLNDYYDNCIHLPCLAENPTRLVSKFVCTIIYHFLIHHEMV